MKLYNFYLFIYSFIYSFFFWPFLEPCTETYLAQSNFVQIKGHGCALLRDNTETFPFQNHYRQFQILHKASLDEWNLSLLRDRSAKYVYYDSKLAKLWNWIIIKIQKSFHHAVDKVFKLNLAHNVVLIKFEFFKLRSFLSQSRDNYYILKIKWHCGKPRQKWTILPLLDTK